MTTDLDPRWTAALRAAGQVRPTPDLDAAWSLVERRTQTTPLAIGRRWTARFAVAALVLAIVGAAAVALGHDGDDDGVRTGSTRPIPEAVRKTFLADVSKTWKVVVTPGGMEHDLWCVGASSLPGGRGGYCKKDWSNPAGPVAFSTGRSSGGPTLFTLVAAPERTVLVRARGARVDEAIDLAAVPGVHREVVDIGGHRYAAYTAAIPPDADEDSSSTDAIELSIAPNELGGRILSGTPQDWSLSISDDDRAGSLPTCFETARGTSTATTCAEVSRLDQGLVPSTYQSMMPSASKGLTVPEPGAQLLTVLAPAGRTVLVRGADQPPGAAVALTTATGVHTQLFDVGGVEVIVYTAVIRGPVDPGPSDPPPLVLSLAP